MPQEVLREFQLDFEKVTNHIVEKLREYIKISGKKGGVVGLSGGIDSTVTSILLSKATQNYKILLMPSESTPKKDIEDALKVIKMIGAEDKYEVIEIDDIVNLISKKVKTNDKVNIGNIKARTRMILLYSVAHDLDYLVVGSGDKSELMIGYFTKYGDGGVDVLPIGDLYKTQVRLLGKYLGVPEEIVKKPSSPALWPGHKAEEELGMSYELIDSILLLRYEKGYSVVNTARKLGVSESVVQKVDLMVRTSEHKRNPPVIIKIK
ncbi:MAG: NAD+ synthase [Sulfolobaceae archaeon]